MKESVGELIHKMSSFGPKIATGTVNGGAGAVTLAPQQVFGEFLNQNGIGLLSYSEIIKIIGAIWVSLLIIEYLAKYIRCLIKKAKK